MLQRLKTSGKLEQNIDFSWDHKISLTENFGSCDKNTDLINKYKLIEIHNILGVESNACDDIPKSGWNMDVLEL